MATPNNFGVNVDSAWDNSNVLPYMVPGISENVKVVSGEYSVSDKGNWTFKVKFQSDPSDNPDDSRQHTHNFILENSQDPKVAKRNDRHMSDLMSVLAAGGLDKTKAVNFVNTIMVKPEEFAGISKLLEGKRFRLKLIHDANADLYSTVVANKPFIEPMGSARLVYNPAQDDKKKSNYNGGGGNTNTATPGSVPPPPPAPGFPPMGNQPQYPR